MVRLSDELIKIVRIVPSQKSLVGLPCNVEYKAISAEAGSAHGLSPTLAVLDEVGQVRGPHDPFVEAIETAQGAHLHPLLIAISTQAATDGDLFSLWLDDATNSADPRIVSHLYTPRRTVKSQIGKPGQRRTLQWLSFVRLLILKILPSKQNVCLQRPTHSAGCISINGSRRSRLSFHGPHGKQTMPRLKSCLEIIALLDWTCRRAPI